MNRRTWTLAIIATALWLLSPARGDGLPRGDARAEGFAPEALARIGAMLDDAVSRRQIAGGAALVARRGKVVYLADPADIKALRRHVRTQIARTVGEFSRFGAPDHVVATSKTFKQLARMAGAAPSAEGLYVPRRLFRADLSEWIGKLARMPSAERAQLPGVSVGLGARVLHEPLTVRVLIGMAIVLIGIALSRRRAAARPVAVDTTLAPVEAA